MEEIQRPIPIGQGMEYLQIHPSLVISDSEQKSPVAPQLYAEARGTEFLPDHGLGGILFKVIPKHPAAHLYCKGRKVLQSLFHRFLKRLGVDVFFQVRPKAEHICRMFPTDGGKQLGCVVQPAPGNLLFQALSPLF